MNYLFSHFGFVFLPVFKWFSNALMKIKNIGYFISHFGKMLNAAENKLK